MKNIKNTIAASALIALLSIGTVSANTGLMVSDKGNGQTTCGSVKDDGIYTKAAGILIIGAPLFDGILNAVRNGLMVSDRSGLMVSDKGCNQGKTGLLMSDRSGFLISD